MERRWPRLFLLTVLLGGWSCAPHDIQPVDQRPVTEWQLFRSPDGKLSVRMPASPTPSHEHGMDIYTVHLGPYNIYWVGIKNLPAAVGSSPWEALERGRDAVVEPMTEHGKAGRLLRSERGDWFGKPCVTYFAEATPSNFPRTLVMTRLILDVNKDHTVTVMISHATQADNFREEQATLFIDSLRLLDR